MSLPGFVTIAPDAMARQVADETVLLHLSSGTYYGLDPVGTRVWQLLVNGLSPAEACRALQDEYDVDAADLEADVARLIGELAAHGLIFVHYSQSR